VAVELEGEFDHAEGWSADDGAFVEGEAVEEGFFLQVIS